MTEGPLLRVLEEVRMVASADTTVLLLGETGTGKETRRPCHPRGVDPFRTTGARI